VCVGGWVDRGSYFFQIKIVSIERNIAGSSKTVKQPLWLLKDLECSWQCLCPQKQNILLDKLTLNITVFRNVIIFTLVDRH